MAENLPFDIQQSHLYFAAHCFNKTWELLAKEDRTPAEDDQMRHLTHASMWHWSQLASHTPENLSIASCQLSRVYAALGQVETARRYAEKCLQLGEQNDLSPLHRAYGYEALGRAEAIAENPGKCRNYLNRASQIRKDYRQQRQPQTAER